MNLKPSSASLRRRRVLTVITALLFSAVIFMPLSVALYRDGSVFFLGLWLLTWLAGGRFVFHLLSPAPRSRPPNADSPNPNGDR